MRDWQELVRQRLSGLKLGSAETEEVHAELAAHLEESYEVFCKEGLPEKEAVHRTFEQVADWRDLQRRIFMAKRSGHPMQKRVHQLWIPGFLTLILSIVFLATLQNLGFHARMVSSHDHWFPRTECADFGGILRANRPSSKARLPWPATRQSLPWPLCPERRQMQCR